MTWTGFLLLVLAVAVGVYAVSHLADKLLDRLIDNWKGRK